MKLRAKMIALSLVPSIVLGIILFLVASNRIADSVYDQAYVGMEATALAVRDIFEIGNDGEYHVDGNGDLWKGNSLNISQAADITDHIKKSTDMEVTVFWGDTRILTSIVNERGERQIHTKASDKVVQEVLKEGNIYLDRNVEILGNQYIVCYTPIYQSNTNEIVGMIFLGTLQQKGYCSQVDLTQRNRWYTLNTVETTGFLYPNIWDTLSNRLVFSSRRIITSMLMH